MNASITARAAHAAPLSPRAAVLMVASACSVGLMAILIRYASHTLHAFEIARRSVSDLGLVLVGPAGWGDVTVPTIPGVRLLGFLGPHELHLAYAGARAFCYPSLREGFGLPVLEAMAHGIPVVTSAGSAMAEFADGAGILVDPLDADALATAIVAAVGDEHDALADAAAKRAAEYSWGAAAAATVTAYHEASGA